MDTLNQLTPLVRVFFNVVQRIEREREMTSQPLIQLGQRTPRSRRNRSETVFSESQPTLTAAGRDDKPPAADLEQQSSQDLPSNQLSLQQRKKDEEEPPVKSKLPLPPPEDNTHDDEFEDEWTNMSLLTQFIGSPANTEPTAAGNVNNPDRKVNKLEGLKKEFLDHTDSLDRGQRHLEALDRAVTRRRIPARLRITIQPQVNTTNNLSKSIGLLCPTTDT